MSRTELQREMRTMRFEEAYTGRRAGRLGVWERAFRRYIDRYEEDGVQGLIDERLLQVSHRRARWMR